MSEERQGTQIETGGEWGKLPGGIPAYIQEFKARHWLPKAQPWADLAHGPPFVTSTGETFAPGRPHQGCGLGVGRGECAESRNLNPIWPQSALLLMCPQCSVASEDFLSPEVRGTLKWLPVLTLGESRSQRDQGSSPAAPGTPFLSGR